MNGFYRLLAYGYFPKELPPVFTTRRLASPNLLQQKQFYRQKLNILCPDAFGNQTLLILNQFILNRLLV